MAATPALAESLALAKARNNDPSRCGFELCRHILLGVRESRLCRPDLVLKYGGYLLHQHASSLSHEVWAAYEQLYAALLQAGRYTSKRQTPDDEPPEMREAQECIDRLNARFPGSLRVQRLEGMMWEAKGEPELALGAYDDIIAEDSSSLLTIKRKVGLLRSRGGKGKGVAAAAKLLCEYLETFCSDPDGWLMLHELYLASQRYGRARFCIEELILINPMAYIYHARAGEVMYTMGVAADGGSHDQLLSARKYFAHALELRPEGCLRALYGILLVCAAIGTSSKGTKGAKGADTAELLAHIQPQLIRCYTPASGPASPMRPLVMALVKKLQGAPAVSQGS